MSSAWNFCRLVADVPPRETSPAAKSEEKRMFSQATAVGKKRKPLPLGDLSILLEAVNIIPLSIFHIMCIFVCLFR